MSKIVITNKHLVKHKVQGNVVYLEFKPRLRVSLISKLGFSMRRTKNKVRMHNLQPVVGFSINPGKMEFREKLREGLIVIYHMMTDGNVEITIIDENGNGELLALSKSEE
jgi:hypothetical protein